MAINKSETYDLNEMQVFNAKALKRIESVFKPSQNQLPTN